jgi:hypothetical protein
MKPHDTIIYTNKKITVKIGINSDGEHSKTSTEKDKTNKQTKPAPVLILLYKGEDDGFLLPCPSPGFSFAIFVLDVQTN